jgi:hypothetical protein
MKIPTGRASRADDELVLDMLRLRRSMVSTEVSAFLGCSPERVRTATQRVRDDDRRYSGEPLDGFYPWGKA